MKNKGFFTNCCGCSNQLNDDFLNDSKYNTLGNKKYKKIKALKP
jgi:hypothetical protein